MLDEELKKLLEQKYKKYFTENTWPWQALQVVEETYVEFFGKEEFKRFIKERL